MKIAILTSGILPVPAVQGGAVENLIDFYLEYNAQHHSHDITIYSIRHENVEHHAALRATNNHYYYINTSTFWSKIKRKIYCFFHKHEYYNHYIEYYFEKAYQHLRRVDYDCIIIENRPGYALKLSQRGHYNLALHLHNDLLNNDTPYHQEIFNHFSLVIAVSNYIKCRVSSIASHNKIQTIYNGIDLTQFSSKEKFVINRENIGLLPDDFVVVYSGRINKDKGISELVDAILLLQDIPQIKLLVIGSSFYGNVSNEDEFVCSLKNKAQKIKKNIFFTGFIPYSQMPNYLQLADIAVIPSIWDDPFPTTVLEAQAMGLPCIVSNRGGIPEEVAPDCATILNITPTLPQDLAAAIIDLYTHPEKRKQMSEAALKRSQQFCKERYACEFFRALENCFKM